MDTLLESDVWRSLLPALLHTLWIGAAITLILALVLRALPASRSELRYGLSILAMVALIMGGVLTWAIQQKGSSSPAPSLARVETFIPSNESGKTASDPGFITPVDHLVSKSPRRRSAPFFDDAIAKSPFHWSSLGGGVWLIGVALMLVRNFSSLGRARRLCNGSHETTDGSVLEVSFESVRKRMKIARRVSLRISDLIVTPLVIGFFRPVILWPASWVTGLPENQIVSVLAHEMAHIRRHDYLVNILQMLVEALLFFNPAIWWISRRIRIEREACCDTLAALTVGDAHSVAATLSRVAHMTRREESTPLPASAMMMADRRSSLVDRVRRLLEPGHRPEVHLPWSTPVVAALLFAVFLGLAGAGARMAVAALLDGPTYVAEIQKIQNDFNRGSTDEGSVPADDHVSVSGRVTTHDGKPFPEDCRLVVLSDRPENRDIKLGKLNRDGSFSIEQIQHGKVVITVRATGYAPTSTKPVTVAPGENLDNIQLELTEGFSMQVTVRDEVGTPLPNVPIQIFLSNPAGSSSPGHQTTNAEGQLIVPHLAECTLSTICRKAGYQRQWDQTETKAGQAFPITLTPTLPSSGQVVDAATGQPVPQAELRLIYGPMSMTYEDPRRKYYGETPADATSDRNGDFVLDTLHRGASHSVWIEADGYRPEVIFDVRSGQKNLQVALEPEIIIKAKILGPLDALENPETGEPELPYSQSLSTSSEGGRTYSGAAPIKMENGVAVATLDYKILPGPLEISIPSGPLLIEAAEDTAEITIDLNDQSTDEEAVLKPRPTRRVILQFIPPDGWPIPEGDLTLHFAERRKLAGSLPHKLSDGQVIVDVPLNSKGENYLSFISLNAPGYWMKRGSSSSLEIKEGSDPQKIEFNIYPAGVITGRVIDEAGNPLPGALVELDILENPKESPRPGLFTLKGARADDEGRFLISPVPLGGLYRPKCSSSQKLILDQNEARSFGEPVRVDSEHTHPEISLILPRGEDLEVIVVDHHGDPVPAARVSLNFEAEHGYLQQEPAETDGQGRILFKRVNFELPVSYFLETRPTGTLAGERTQVDSTSRSITVRLEPGLRLEGVIVDDEFQQPIAHRWITVTVIDHESEKYTTYERIRTDEAGRFLLRNLGPGTYRLELDGTGTVSDDILIQGGSEPSPVELRIKSRNQAVVQSVPRLRYYLNDQK